MRLSSLVLVVSSVLTACSGEADRPPAASLTADDANGHGGRIADVETVAEKARPAPCTPGEQRACRVYFFSETYWHCFSATQECRKDGRDWRTCGDHSPAEAERVEEALPAALTEEDAGTPDTVR